MQDEEFSRKFLQYYKDDTVDHPKHYTAHPTGIECITIVEHFTFNVGNAIKYLWRAGLKGEALEDLRKAVWYIQREIELREKRPISNFEITRKE